MQPAFARPAQRHQPRRRAAAAASERPRRPRVTVAWTPPNDVMPTEVELVADFEPSSTTGAWTWHERFRANWVEAIASARCREVVLTARIGNDAPGKHLVLELAEQLTLTLTATHPLIRVRFLPALDEPRDA